MFKTILICSDLTNTSLPALDLGLRLAQDEHSRLIALHVLDLPVEIRRWGAPMLQFDERAYRNLVSRHVEAARRVLVREVSTFLGEEAETRVRCLVRAGVPAAVVAATADEVKADLIITARGRGGDLGSVAERIVRLVGRTVLVAPVRKLALPRKSRQPPPRARLRGGAAA